MSRYVFSDEAENNLTDIGQYVARESRQSAELLVRRIQSTCALLADFPSLGIQRPDLGHDVRSLPVRTTPYMILYRPIEDGVEILRVWHGRRAIRLN